MEDEEDDLYGSAQPDNADQAPTNGEAPVKAEQMEVSEEEEDSEDVWIHRLIHSQECRSDRVLCRTLKSQPNDPKV